MRTIPISSIRTNSTYLLKTIISFIVFLFLGICTYGQGVNTSTPSEPYRDLSHEKKKGTIKLTSGEELTGLISYKEFGKRFIYFFPEDGGDSTVFKDNEEIISMRIEGRGTFESIYLFDGATKKAMALRTEANDSYIEYKIFSHERMIIEPTDPNVRIIGSYNFYLKHHRTGKMINAVHVKRLKKKIRDYIDYCDEIAEKVENKEKDYKVTLLFRDYPLLKKCIIEADKVCPK